MAKKQITRVVHGFSGYGESAVAARQDAINRIESLHQGGWEPILVSWRGHTVLGYRTVHGWVSRFLQHDHEPLKVSTGSQLFGSEATRSEVQESLENHIVQLGWTVDDPVALFPEWFTDGARRKEAIEYRQWQLRYRDLRAEGYSEVDAHRLATERGYRFSAA